MRRVDGQVIANPKEHRDASSDRFATSVSENFSSIAREHHAIARLPGLLELVALSRAFEELETIPQLGFWLHNDAAEPSPNPEEC